MSHGDPAHGGSEGGCGSGCGPGGEEAPADPVCVGRIVRARGVQGELEVQPFGETVLGLDEGARLFLEKKEGAEPGPFLVEVVRELGPRLGLKLRGVDTPERAKTLVGASIMIEAEALPKLPEGQYYHYQIIGITVVDVGGVELGEIADVLETGGNDVYVVRDGKQEILLPATDQVIVAIDLEAGRMTVNVPPGLIE